MIDKELLNKVKEVIRKGEILDTNNILTLSINYAVVVKFKEQTSKDFLGVLDSMTFEEQQKLFRQFK